MSHLQSNRKVFIIPMDPSHVKDDLWWSLYFLLLQQVVLLVSAIEYHNSVHVHNNLSRQSILPPGKSLWQHLYENGDCGSFVLMTGVTRHVFRMLLRILYNPRELLLARFNYASRPGRKPSLLPPAELGLFLYFIGSTMNIKHLCMLFGSTPSVCLQSLRKLLKRIPRKLLNHPFAKVKLPSEEKMHELAALVHSHEPIANDVIGFMDRLSLHSECNSNTVEQNAMYSGYHSDTMVNNIFTNAADGKVFLCGLNFHRSSHDGSICMNLMPIIKDKIGSYKICVGQGFPRSGNAYDILVGPMSRRTAGRLSPFIQPYLLQLSNCYVSLRQASEWGMKGLQGSFPRFKKQLPKQQDKEEEYNPVHSPCP